VIAMAQPPEQFHALWGDAVALADEDDNGGAQVGYNYQIGSFVIGLEGDITTPISAARAF
jgi:hypothetical protein